MAFTVTSDHARQEQVWDSLSRTFNKEPYYIRRLLTESAVRVSDRRAQFVGVETYEAAGGVVMRDLFSDDQGGWLQDPALLDRLVAEKLETEGRTLAAEGWKWVSVATDFKYGYTNGLRRLAGEPTAVTQEEIASYEALKAEFDALNARYETSNDLPDEVDERLGELETAIADFEDRPVLDGLRLAERYALSFFDAVMIASALRLGCKTFWSEDMQNSMIVDERLTILDPFGNDIIQPP